MAPSHSNQVCALFQNPALTPLTKTRLDAEYLSLQLQLEYATHQARAENTTFAHSLERYTRFKKLTSHLSPDEASALERTLANEPHALPQTTSDELLSTLLLSAAKRITDSNQPATCFSYTHEQGTIHIHFANAIVPNHPFKAEQYGQRKKELRAIANDIAEKHPDARRMTGESWLRNFDTYLDLFPKDQRPIRESTALPQGFGTWGQFYRYDGGFNPGRAREFRATWQFPLKCLVSEGPIDSFYSMYLP